MEDVCRVQANLAPELRSILRNATNKLLVSKLTGIHPSPLKPWVRAWRKRAPSIPLGIQCFLCLSERRLHKMNYARS